MPHSSPERLVACRLDKSGAVGPAGLDDAIATLVSSLNSGSLIVLSGAGVSTEYPALLPLAIDGQLPGLTGMLAHILLSQIPNHLAATAAEDVRRQNLESLLDEYVRVIGDDALEFLQVFGPSAKSPLRPNYRHFALALLAQHRACREFLTVNFDEMFERAFSMLGVPLTVPENLPDELHGYSLATTEHGREAAVLYKLHGSLLRPGNLLTTVERVATGLPAHKRVVLESLMPANDLLVMGYSNNDLDVFPAINAIGSDRAVVWYELSEPPQSPSVRAFLRKRRHYVVVGDLDAMLRAVLGQLGIGDDGALDAVGARTLSELKRLEGGAIPARTADLYRFRDWYAAQLVPPAAANLMVSHIVSPEKANAREELFTSLVADRVPSELKYAYYAELASRNGNSGQLHEAIKDTRTALNHLPQTRFGHQLREKTRLEQTIRIGGSFLGLFKRKSRLGSLFPAALYLACARLLLALGSRRLGAFYRATFRSMLSFHSGDLWQFIAEGLLEHQVRIQIAARGPVTSRLRRLVPLAARLAEISYRRALDVGHHSAGWNLLCNQRLAEVLMHRHGNCPEEARRLIGRTRELGKTTDSLVQPQEALGPHEGLMSYYEGDTASAIATLRRTYEYYELTQHTSGRVKTMLFLAFCYARTGEWRRADECLLIMRDQLRHYH